MRLWLGCRERCVWLCVFFFFSLRCSFSSQLSLIASSSPAAFSLSSSRGALALAVSSLHIFSLALRFHVILNHTHGEQLRRGSPAPETALGHAASWHSHALWTSSAVCSAWVAAQSVRHMAFREILLGTVVFPSVALLACLSRFVPLFIFTFTVLDPVLSTNACMHVARYCYQRHLWPKQDFCATDEQTDWWRCSDGPWCEVWVG